MLFLFFAGWLVQGILLRMDQVTRIWLIDIYQIIILSDKHNNTVMLFCLAVLSGALCWKWVITPVNLLWWPNGDTRPSDIYAIYLTIKTTFFIAFLHVSDHFEHLLQHFLLRTLLEWHMRYMSLQCHVCHSNVWVTYEIYSVTYMRNIGP